MSVNQQAHGLGHAIGHPALTDSTTGLANALHFELVYSYLFAAGNRGISFTVILLSFGEPDTLGEDELRAAGERIRTTTRDSDLVAHVSHGRFVVLLLGTNLQGARLAADRIESALVDVAPRTPCFGLASYANTMRDSSELLEIADRALLAAEAAGGGVEFG